MVRRIRRINDAGQSDILVNQIEVSKMEPLIVLLARRLGQTEEEAEYTRQLYLNEALDSEDRALLLEEFTLLEKERVAARKAEAQAEGAISFDKPRASMINPRDSSHIKQRVTVRDPISGDVVKLEDV